jgi:CarD family transcriptional regulator
MESTSIVGGAAAMFKVNDVIIYGTQGVCEIVDIEVKSIGGAKKAYYVLRPLKDQSSTIYAPTDNALVLKKMRRLLTVSEINNLIDTMPDEEHLWIDNVNERKECYKKLLACGDHSALIQMIKAIYAHKKEREAAGKRLHTMDENFFKDAERILYTEFQYVLQLSGKDDLMNYILARIGNSQI